VPPVNICLEVTFVSYTVRNKKPLLRLFLSKGFDILHTISKTSKRRFSINSSSERPTIKIGLEHY